MRATQPAKINDVEFAAVINRTENYEASIPDYPVEKGYSVNDSIILQPITLDMTVYLTDTPVTWAARLKDKTVEAVKDELLNLYFERQPVTVTTASGVYENMGISSISIPSTPESGYALEVALKLKQIRMTEASTVESSVSSSYGRSGSTGANAGTAATTSAQPEETQKAGSILYGMIGGLFE